MYFISSYVKKILFLCFRPEKLKHFRKNGHFWIWFLLISVFLYYVFEFNTWGLASQFITPHPLRWRASFPHHVGGYERTTPGQNRRIVWRGVDLARLFATTATAVAPRVHHEEVVWHASHYSESLGVNSKKHFKPFIFEKHFKNHSRIMSYDRFMATNNRWIDLGKPEYPHYKENSKFCYINKKLLGPRTVNIKLNMDLKWVEDQLPMVRSGGFYAPKNCISRHKVAIIVPYRDRYGNLIKFLYYMHPLWQKQYLQYRLFVIEQYGNDKFNKGALYNVAFIETQRFGKWDCLVFHDVDLIALDERLLYTCPRSPTHMSPALDNRNFTLQYTELFGGVTAMAPRHYLATNGYSNKYWDWGAEDDDMYQRLVGARLSMSRLNLTIARFVALPHKQQEVNINRFKQLADARIRYKSEGLSTVQYRVHAIKKRKLFTHIIVNINPFKM